MEADLSTAPLPIRGNAGVESEREAVPADHAEHSKRIQAVRAAAEAVRTAERDLASKRAAYRKAVADAHEAGVTLAALGTELGVTRQRVRRIIDGE
jgi:DNA-directed RNA polymerase sigma subunit (sigma70/sigma32)